MVKILKRKLTGKIKYHLPYLIVLPLFFLKRGQYCTKKWYIYGKVDKCNSLKENFILLVECVIFFVKNNAFIMRKYVLIIFFY